MAEREMPMRACNTTNEEGACLFETDPQQTRFIPDILVY